MEWKFLERCSPFSQAAIELGKKRVLSQFPFNAAQESVLDRVLAFFNEQQETNRIQLIQGVFGSGKSRLIAELLVCMHSLFQARATATTKSEKNESDFLMLSEEPQLFRRGKGAFKSKMRSTILFCSHTNIAVDRVCLLLHEMGFKQFRRTGNIRRIHPSLRSYYRAKCDETDELRVLCTTLCSLPEDLGEIGVLVLDEASQITEYYVGSILPLLHPGYFTPSSCEPSARSSHRRPEAASSCSAPYCWRVCMMRRRHSPNPEFALQSSASVL